MSWFDDTERTVNSGHRSRPSTCLWCGRPVVEVEIGRRRRYCRQSCRQRAYEQRSGLRGAPVADDAVVLTAEDVAALADRAFAVRCAAEDISTALAEGADPHVLRDMADDLVERAKDAERLR